MTDHARLLALTLGLRPSANADLPIMIETAAQAAWTTDRGQPPGFNQSSQRSCEVTVSARQMPLQVFSNLGFCEASC